MDLLLEAIILKNINNLGYMHTYIIQQEEGNNCETLEKNNLHHRSTEVPDLIDFSVAKGIGRNYLKTKSCLGL